MANISRLTKADTGFENRLLDSQAPDWPHQDYIDQLTGGYRTLDGLRRMARGVGTEACTFSGVCGLEVKARCGSKPSDVVTDLNRSVVTAECEVFDCPGDGVIAAIDAVEEGVARLRGGKFFIIADVAQPPTSGASD